MRIQSLIVALTLLFLASWAAQSKPLTATEHKEIEVKMKRVWENSLKFTIPILSHSEKTTVKRLSLRVLSTNSLIARASEDPPSIEISTGLIWLLGNVNMAFIQQEFLEIERCYAAYSEYITGKFEDGATSIRFIERPSQLGLCDCAKISESAMLANAYSRRMFSGGMEAMVYFIILHEIAHYIKGHFSGDDGVAQELDADSWAIEKAYAARFGIEAAMPLVLTFFDMELADSSEPRSHPSAELRFEKFLARLIEEFEKQGSSSRFGVEVQKQRLEQLRGYADHVMIARDPSNLTASCDSTERIENYDFYIDRFMRSMH